MDVKVILTPPCIFHWWLSIQSIQGVVRVTLASAPAGGSFTTKPLLLGRGRHLFVNLNGTVRERKLHRVGSNCGPSLGL